MGSDHGMAPRPPPLTCRSGAHLGGPGSPGPAWGTPRPSPARGAGQRLERWHRSSERIAIKGLLEVTARRLWAERQRQARPQHPCSLR